jgi:hypothetical protein
MSSKTEQVGVSLAVILLIACIMVVSSIAGIISGFICGWIIQAIPFTNNLMIEGFEVFGINVIDKIPQVGAVLGFIGGLIFGRHASHTNNTNKK